MIKKRNLIFIITVILIIVSFNSVVHAANWDFDEEYTQGICRSAFETCWDAFYEAVIIDMQGWNSISMQIWGDYGYGYDDAFKAKVNEMGTDMEVGTQKVFSFVDSEGKTQTEFTIPGPSIAKLIIKREADTTVKKGNILNKKEVVVKQYRPIIMIVSDDGTVGGSGVYKTYREYVEEDINQWYGTNVPLPSEGTELEPGDERVFEHKWSSYYDKYIDITIKARQETFDGYSYIVYDNEIRESEETPVEPTPQPEPTPAPVTPPEDDEPDGDVLENLDYFKPDELQNEKSLKEKAGVIIRIINVVGLIISVITLMLIGFRYMTGSIEEKANYKKAMVPWVIGAIILFSATTLPNVIYTISNNVWNGETTTVQSGGGPSGGGATFTESMLK